MFKRKPALFILSLVALLGSLFLVFANITGKPMQLVNVQSGFIVVEYKGEKTIFHDPFLEDSMRKQGIIIPPAFRKDFSDKSIIRLNDVNFQKAFKEIYYPLSFNQQTFQWKDSSSDDH